MRDGVPAFRQGVRTAPRATPSLRLVAGREQRRYVSSEVAPLRRVLLHRPGAELTRLSPDNMHELLFDDIPWAERAAAEHDVFSRATS